ncbi:hypothetical protein J0H58_32620 [bacterium]|nr:hypothetical protein [bacterium]
MRLYSMDRWVRVLAALNAGDPTSKVADAFAVSPAWVRRLVPRRRETGETAPRKVRDTRVPKLREHLSTIRALLAATPDMTPAELRAEPRVAVALSTLWAAVRSLGLTFKKVPRAAERDRPDVRAARDAWRQEAAPGSRPAAEGIR